MTKGGRKCPFIYRWNEYDRSYKLWKARKSDSCKTMRGYWTAERCLNIEIRPRVKNYWSFCSHFMVKGRKEVSFTISRTEWLSRSALRTGPRNPFKTSPLRRFRPSATPSLFSSSTSRRRVFLKFCETFCLSFPPRPVFRSATAKISNWNLLNSRKSLLRFPN